MDDFIYRVEGDVAHTAAAAHGPWSETMQHGSAPSALVAWAAERVPASAPMHVARLTVDLLRPVPIAPLAIATEIVREGRKIQLLSVSLRAEGTEVVRASVLKIRSAETVLPEEAGAAPLGVPLPEQSGPNQVQPERARGFVSGLEVRAARGGWSAPGPAALWFRAVRPIVAGAAVSPVMRAAIAADFCNGSSSALDFRSWTFLNADLTVSLARPPAGEWILLDAETWFGPDGAAIAFGRLADIRGTFGRAVQSLVIERR